ncbi:MAG: hypothetical protein CVU89_16275 [Firmicutes bacterium HGW-Firmicutes-14]|jgi:pimeloyl-ACP methyl ester carboxylesterase|nr:MAG: hypothetical protein CVU89_16275 [Firmicutes bacterium HGW-Firmicutes-14]
MIKKTVVLLIGILIILTALIWVKYKRDMRVSYERVQGKSSIISTPYGNLEYTEGGVGPNVLVIHGGGGGYDQGELLARIVLGEKFRCITPSRFGYLGSSLPEGATYDDQAHAYAKLLDHLKVEKAAVIGFSAGGPSALLFALLYPDRVSSLTLISAGATNVSEALKYSFMAERVGFSAHPWPPRSLAILSNANRTCALPLKIIFYNPLNLSFEYFILISVDKRAYYFVLLLY